MADSDGIPHALTKAHAELVTALECGIEQFKARLEYSNSHEVCQCIERFVDELRRVPGAVGELDFRKTLVLVRCRQGTRYRELMDRAFKSLRSVTKKKPLGSELSSARVAARGLKPESYMQFESQLTQEIGKIKWALREGVIPVRCRKAFREWLDESRRIVSDAQSVEADGCFYLSSVCHAWDSSATKMEVFAEALLMTNFGGANLESVRAAADSLVDWVGRNLSEKPTGAQKFKASSALTDSVDHVQVQAVGSAETFSDLNPPHAAVDGASSDEQAETVKPTDEEAELARGASKQKAAARARLRSKFPPKEQCVLAALIAYHKYESPQGDGYASVTVTAAASYSTLREMGGVGGATITSFFNRWFPNDGNAEYKRICKSGDAVKLSYELARILGELPSINSLKFDPET